MRITALEEHFVVPELVAAWTRLLGGEAHGGGDDPLSRRLRDTGEERIAAMDDQGVDVQVLSLTSPGVQNLGAADAVHVAREANDALAGIVAGNPDRFQAFAAVPTPDAEGAAAELERALTTLRFRGALLNGRTGTVNADDPRFDDLYGVAARRSAPLYLHPQTPVEPVRQQYYDGFGDASGAFANHAIGWHYETGVQLLRMILGGVFDRHPDLQVVVGHWGEVVLFFLERFSAGIERSGLHLDRPIADYFRQNVWVTGSGVLSERYLRWTAEVVGVERILYSTDYPYIDTGAGRARAFLEQAPFSAEQKAAIGSGAWERLTGHLA
jgi:hypothetical protein